MANTEKTKPESEQIKDSTNTIPETEYEEKKSVKKSATGGSTRKKSPSVSKGQSDLEDALGMLSSMFYKILKVNLTQDSFKDVSFFTGTDNFSTGSEVTGFTQWLLAFVERGDVASDDLELYADFTNLDNLRFKFHEGNTYVSFKYHHRLDGEYRWIMMEMLKSCEYTEENQIVVLYMRDVHEEYLRQKDEFLHLSSNAVKTCMVNLTANKVDYSYGPLSNRSGQLSCSYEQFINEISQKVPTEKERQEYLGCFCLSNLLTQYENGIKNITYEHPYYSDDENYHMIRSTMILSEDAINRNIVGNFFAFDITPEYVNSVLPRLLFSNDFWTLSIINTQSSEIAFLDLSEGGPTTSIPSVDYETTMNRICETYVVPAERELFRKRCTFSHIKKRIDTNGIYEFTVNVIGDNGEPRLLKNKYQYFQKELGFILHIIEDVTSLSEQDMLTGEYNRQGFITHATEILKNPEDTNQYAILYMDIKRFKAINELFGTEVGDSILRKIPQLAAHSFLKPILTARHTADRFVFLVNAQNLDYKELTNFCTFKYDAAGKSIMIYIHCGIFLIEDKSMDVNSMCNRATIAERFIDNEYLRPYAIFESKMSETYVDRSALYNSLPDALANEEFQPYYQPIFDAQTGEVVSAEALVRWFHPQLGFMNPGLFVPALEEGGYISSVDLMIAEHVQKFLEMREKEGKPIVPVSINLSRMDFYDTEMMQRLQTKVSETSLGRGFHRFEVTESSYMDITETDVSLLNNLRSLGAKILIDDFGSGYSSFGTIADYDFDIIKLDMAFIQKIGKNSKIESIIHSLIDMAHHMDAKVIAEGAETKAQVDFLRRHNCDYIQGYYFSKPLPEKDFIELLDHSRIKSFVPQKQRQIKTNFFDTPAPSKEIPPVSAKAEQHSSVSKQATSQTDSKLTAPKTEAKEKTPEKTDSKTFSFF